MTISFRRNRTILQKSLVFTATNDHPGRMFRMAISPRRNQQFGKNHWFLHPQMTIQKGCLDWQFRFDEMNSLAENHLFS